MSMIVIVILGLFILCNILLLSAIFASSKADRFDMDSSKQVEVSPFASEGTGSSTLHKADSAM